MGSRFAAEGEQTMAKENEARFYRHRNCKLARERFKAISANSDELIIWTSQGEAIFARNRSPTSDDLTVRNPEGETLFALRLDEEWLLAEVLVGRKMVERSTAGTFNAIGRGWQAASDDSKLWKELPDTKAIPYCIDPLGRMRLVKTIRLLPVWSESAVASSLTKTTSPYVSGACCRPNNGDQSP